MSSEETESDVIMKPESHVEMKPEGLNSGEGFVGHARRKRSRSGRSSFSGGGVGVSPANKVFYTASCEGKYKDIGWEHGEMVVPGNRFSWKCKWCGLARNSGGVTRLKKHLAGAKHISPCQKVPEHVARSMKDNLLELEKKQLWRQITKHNDVTKISPELLCLDTSVKREAGETDLVVQMSDATKQSERTAKSSKTAREQSRDSNQPSLFASRRSKTNMAKVSNGSHQLYGAPTRSRLSSKRSRSSYKRSSICNQRHEAELAKQSMKRTQDTMLCTKTYDKYGFARKDDHWRNILGNMLHLPDLCEDGGIRTCIIDALTSSPSDLSRMFKMADVTKDTVDPQDSYRGHCEEQSQFSSPNIPADIQLDLPETETYNRKLVVTNTMKCQEVFLDLLCSKKFVLMCDLLGQNFQDINAEKLFDFSQINLNMKNGVYEQSPGVFNQDIQQVWKKFQKIGQQMVLWASDLSNMSGDFYQKAVGEDVMCQDVVNEAVEPQCEDNNHFWTKQKDSNDLDIDTPFPSCESNRSTKRDQTEASILYKVCTSKQCGSEANGENSLICDECEAVYHLSCAEPAVQEIRNQSWYCASCTKDQRLSPNAVLSNAQDSVHDSCVVCDRLDIVEVKEDVKENYSSAAASGSREGSVSSMESDEPPEPSRTALSRLCKQCGTYEDEDKRFLICGHNRCSYKFYHIRCLKTSQIASLQQQNKHCWYCPSCLCRACFVDKDDDKIVLCDNCDEAYHTYCMKPPRTSIPEGQWHCVQCNVAKAKEGMKRYEEWIIQMHGKEVKQPNEANRLMDVLLSAVEKLSSDEQPLQGRKITTEITPMAI